MKKFIFVLLVLALGTPALAQSNKEDLDIIQSVLGKEKKAIVADFVKLQGAQADAFWKSYDEYETQRKALGARRVALLEKYASNYGTMDDATLDQIMKDTQKLSLETDKLIVKYYGIIKKGAGVKSAAQFWQIEGYFLSVVRATILENIPMIGELDDKW